jgi:hypothetical protein
MARQGIKVEEMADRPVRLTGSNKARLKHYMEKHGFKTQNETVSILLDVAEVVDTEYSDDIVIKAKPSITIKGESKGW